ncbi:hypothetical protein L6164_008632 [Bauhinia variegata]|uniref:Uncharacterized protein n=1 Tax=Bauhinia variegata TaxID=167791 RepID=A0ACB9PMY8_BAUVA|nr:hypothetical protein L6164_008632 [Bauhinia variegata]
MGDPHNPLNNLPPPNRHLEDPPPQPRTMRDFVMPPVSGCGTGIRKPTINANNFEIKASLIQLVQQNQFRGERNENPYTHISAFTYFCSTIKINGASEEAIKLMVFPFSLADMALSWYQALKPDSTTDWNTLVQKFINKYHPPTLRNKLRGQIVSFQQAPSESLTSAFERFQELLRKCPGHGLEEWRQVEIFY